MFVALNGSWLSLSQVIVVTMQGGLGYHPTALRRFSYYFATLRPKMLSSGRCTNESEARIVERATRRVRSTCCKPLRKNRSLMTAYLVAEGEVLSSFDPVLHEPVSSYYQFWQVL